MRIRCILLVILIFCAGCREQIVHNLSEKEANRLLTKLHSHALHPQKIREPDGGWAISVDKGEVMQALRFLDESRLLRAHVGSASKGSSMISSREEQQFQYEQARSRQIESTLASVEGVLEARVHLNIERTDPLLGRSQEHRKRSSASVLLITNSDYGTESGDISQLIAGAAGLDPNRVMVLVNPSTASSQVSAIDSEVVGYPEPRSLSEKILSVLSAEQLVMGVGSLLFAVGIALLAHSLFPRRAKQQVLKQGE